MATGLAKQNFNLNFQKGVSTKSDPFQIPLGNFAELENMVFDELNALKKRNGFGFLTSLPDTTSTLAATFNGNLLAIGTELQAYSAPTMTWVDKGKLQPIGLDTLPLIRSSTNQSQADSAVSSNGLVCTAYTDAGVYKYAVSVVATGQAVVVPTTFTATVSPKVFVLGNYFMVLYGNSANLNYIAINVFTLAASAVTAISTQGSFSSTGNFDAFVANNILYVALNGSDGGGAVRITYLNSNLSQGNTVVLATYVATLMSVTADVSGSTPNIWITFYDSVSTLAYVAIYNPILVQILAPTAINLGGAGVVNLTGAATGSLLTILYERADVYSGTAIATDAIKYQVRNMSGASAGSGGTFRGLGLASKAFVVGTTPYAMAAYSSTFQPSYFLVDFSGNVIGKLAYQNGGGYLVTGVPNVTVINNVAHVPYLVKDSIQAINKTQGSANPSAVYSQTGVNLAKWDFARSTPNTSEIGNNLHVSGGILWAYDGVKAVEQNFNVWPEIVQTTTATTTGSMTAQIYYYVATYEWVDNYGNVHRSAPSIPAIADLHTSGTATNKVTVQVPTLRITYKPNVQLVLYRWSTAQQTYYRVTSLSSPTLNNTAVDSVSFVDTQADSSILGNNILYTTGGIVEDIGPPATLATALFRSRLFLIDAEDRNLLWYSKQVIENTPVELSDLFTLYVPPQLISSTASGRLTAIAAMDDKLIIFRENAILYITGAGPDNTGANNDFSDAILITSVAGCSNQSSIVLTPNGLMFQSNKGIWLLSRDLNTTYIGADVEAYNSYAVNSAVNVPATNQVRFSLSNGVTLMYDYFVGQWGTFSKGAAAVSGCIYAGLHTIINSYGKVLQETPNAYLDGTTPVLMHFKTSWIALAQLQGYQRVYQFTLLGQYLSPHILILNVGYDYEIAPTQTSTVTPDNFSGAWGSNATTGDTTGYGVWGDGAVWGGASSLEKWRIFCQRGWCEAVQFSLQETYDASYGVPAGAGLTLSGINLVAGIKKGYRPQSAARSVG